eukprot:2877979-Pleurochrysis_carterae.AAC.1
MNSASSTSVSRLYAAPPVIDGSTNGSRSVNSVKSRNPDSALPVRRASTTSMTRAFSAVRSACRLRLAGEEGSPPRNLSSSSAPRGPASPMVAALCTTPAASAARVLRACAAPAMKDDRSARQPPPVLVVASTPGASPGVGASAAAAALGGVALSRSPSAGVPESGGPIAASIVCHQALTLSRAHSSSPRSLVPARARA